VTSGLLARAPRAGRTVVQSTRRAVPDRRRGQLGMLAVVIPFALVGAARAGSFAEGDTFWQVQTGTDVLARHTTSLTDTFSWTIAGRPWHPNSWLYDVLLALAHAWGATGLGLAALFSVTSTGVGVAVAGRWLGSGVGPLMVTSLLAMPVLVPWLSARPQTVSYLLLPIVVGLAARVTWWRGRRLLGGLAALFVVSALWANLHLAALSGVFASAAGLAVLLLARRGHWLRLLPGAAAVLTAVVLGCASTPLGWSVVGSALATRDASTRLITEWAPLWRAAPICVATWLIAAGGLALIVAAWRRRPHDDLLPVWAGATAVLLVLGVSAARFSAMALVLALPAAAVWARDTDWTGHRLLGTAKFLAVRMAAALGGTFAVLAVLWLPHLGQPSEDMPDRSVVEAIPAGCRVLNEYDDGGYITMLRNADGVRVAQDGRNDVYGEAVLVEVQSLIDGRDGALATLGREDVGCLLLDPDRAVVGQARAAGWRTVAADDHRVLLVAPR
jgi:hypothetical protein